MGRHALPDKKKKNQRVTARFRPSDFRAIEKEARAQGHTTGAFVENVVIAHVLGLAMDHSRALKVIS